MIGRKVEYLLLLLGTDNSRLAEYAGCSESNFSRMRSGSRKLTVHSSTVRRFADAVCACAEDKGLTGRLCSLTGCGSQERDELCGAVIEWMFSDDELSSMPDGLQRDPAAFGTKLDRIMEIAEFSNSRLARQANVDPSYISRMRSGKRMPKNNPELVNRLCEVIAVRAQELGKSRELAGTVGIQGSGITPEEFSHRLAAWLFDHSGADDALAVKRLLRRIRIADNVSPDMLMDFDLVAKEEILNDTRTAYYGIDGLRNALVRFLGNAVKDGSVGLMMYSDQNLNLIQHEYFPVWITLLHECLSRGINIWVVQNLDRTTEDLIERINNWMPLYMTGYYEPYYCPLRQGERFSTTIFSNPGRACLTGVCVRSCEHEMVYHYITDPKELEAFEHQMCTLFSSSSPLLKITQGLQTPEGEYTEVTQNGMRLCIGSSIVTVSRLTEPNMTFTFDHPKMLAAFKAYAAELNKGETAEEGSEQ